jgi:hypothetical protein
VQLSPVISTIVAELSSTGTLSDGVHVPSSSARAKTPVPAEVSPTASQFPHDVQSTAHNSALVLLVGPAFTDSSVQSPPFSIKSAGMLVLVVDSSPTATQPPAVQLTP